LWYGPMSDRTSLTLQLTSAESVSRHVSVQMVDIRTLFVNKLLQTICILNFSCVFGSSGFYPSCQIFTVLMLDGR